MCLVAVVRCLRSMRGKLRPRRWVYKVTSSSTLYDEMRRHMSLCQIETQILERQIRLCKHAKEAKSTALTAKKLTQGDKKLFYSLMMKRRLSECSCEHSDYADVDGVLIMARKFEKRGLKTQ